MYHHHHSYGSGSVRPIDRAKSDQELLIALKKATSPEETSPKQKHVRSCMLYTWDHKTSLPFWAALKNSPLFADEVQAFKTLITIHKVIRDGHPACLPEAITEKAWLDNLPRMLGPDFRGYGALIRGYIDFLSSKLEFHRLHPDFTGTFDYEEYTSLRRTTDPNEGYETIMELMNLQDKVDRFQRQIFSAFTATSNNECRIAALVPMVEESYGIYKFITSMLRAMHRRVGSIEALDPLRTRYDAQHRMLYRFYNECSRQRYLTSLITVPKLSADPPSLYDTDDIAPPPAPIEQHEPEPEPEPEPAPAPVVNNDPPAWIQQQLMEQQRALEASQQHMAMMQQQQTGMLNDRERRLRELEEQLARAKARFDQDQTLLMQYDARVRALEGQLGQLQMGNQNRDDARDDLIRKLQEELAALKAKYEALAKLYAELRNKHLDLLKQHQEAQRKAQMVGASQDQIDKINAQLRNKNLEMADMIRDRDRYKDELARLKDRDNEDEMRLRKEIDDLKYKLDQMSKSKGTEVERIMNKLNAEKSDLEQLARAKQALAEDLRRQLDELRSQMDVLARSKDDEIAILQAGMDQSILALAEMRQRSEEGEGDLAQRMQTLEQEHAMQLDKILDTILRNCVYKVEESVFELDSTAHLGNQTATPEYALTVIEKAANASSEFAKAFQAYLAPGGDQTDAITTANTLAYTLTQMLHNIKGVMRLTDEDQFAESLMAATKRAAEAAKQFFTAVQSANLGAVDVQQRSGLVIDRNNQVQAALGNVVSLTERLVSKEVASVTVDDNVADVVDREMLSAANAIREAAERLQELMNSTANFGLSAKDLQVHTSILSAAKALTNAIANLIRCAIVSQQEIVAHGRGSSSKTAFYKKNNRWTEGLISAAKAIAVATTNLVETADGLVRKTHNMEQLMVSAEEVAAATAQLMAASRVKAIQGSKTQDQLEVAATAVTNASKLLVRAAKEASRKAQEEREAGVDYKKLSAHELKTQEMEQKVMILTLEKDLAAARSKLAEMRRVGYHS
ncbi:sla2 Src-like adaptor 2 [Sorochytrium milnesiophthora]